MNVPPIPAQRPFLSETQRLLVLVAIGFVLRLAIAFALGINTPPPAADPTDYDSVAWNLAQGHGYRAIMNEVSDTEQVTAWRLPVTPLVWSGVYAVCGHRYSAIRVMQCLVGAATILMVFGIGQCCFGKSTAWIAAIIYTGWPHAILMPSYLQSEVLGTFCFLWFMLITLQFAKQPSWGRVAAAGVLLGCALLTRGPIVFMMPLLILWALWQFRKQRREMIRGLAIPAVAILALVPWTVRNYAVFGEFIPLCTGGGVAFLECNNRVVVSDPLWYGYAIYGRRLPEFRELIARTHNESEISRVCTQWTVQWLKDNPDKWSFLLWQKFRRSWTPFLQPHVPWSLRVGSLLSWGPLLVLFVPAFFPTLIMFLRRGHPGWLLHLGILHFVLNAIPFCGMTRYRYPIEGLCIILASFSITWLWSRFHPAPVASALSPGAAAQ